MGYDFSEVIKGVRERATEPEITAVIKEKNEILFELIERLYKRVKRIQTSKKNDTLKFVLGEVSDNGDAASEITDLERRVEKNYLKKLLKESAVRSLSFSVLDIYEVDEPPRKVEIATFDFDVRRLKKRLKETALSKRRLRARPEYDEKMGKLTWADKVRLFKSAKSRKLFGLLWKERRLIPANRRNTSSRGGSLTDINTLVEELLGVKDEVKKADAAKMQQKIRDLRKQLRGFPVKIESARDSRKSYILMVYEK